MASYRVEVVGRCNPEDARFSRFRRRLSGVIRRRSTHQAVKFMTSEIVIDSNLLAWEQSKWPGIGRRQLRLDAETGGRTVLLKFEPGALLPRHMHPGGEELFVLDGRVRIDGKWYEKGWYHYQPPDSVDDVFSDTGGTLLVMLPKPHVDLP